jgi:asparagine synthase (glutamine-hydrolysing)
LDAIPLLPTIYDEPFADSSQIPSYLVCALARSQVTVALSGDGGDELFGGYNRYVWVPRLARLSAWIPKRARHTTAAILSSVNPTTWDRILAGVGPYLPSKFQQRTVGDKFAKLIDGLRATGPDGAYQRVISHWQEPTSLVIDAIEPKTLLSDPSGRPRIESFTQMMMFLDATTYLPDDILAKVDRASMASSLEMRPPYLDHRVIEFAWRLPVSLKIAEGVGKAPLRGLLDRYVPRSLIERPKMGFGVPIGDWLRGPLKDWASSLLDPQILAKDGILRPEPILRLWDEHTSGRANRQYPLWDVLMFQSWLESSCQLSMRTDAS